MSDRPPRDPEKDKELKGFGLKILLAVIILTVFFAVVLAWRL